MPDAVSPTVLPAEDAAAYAEVGVGGAGRGWSLAVLVACITFCSVAVRLPFSIEPPGRDQSLFMAQAQALMDGASLYTEIWEHKPPGVLAAYALVQKLAGRGYAAIHLLNWLAGWCSAFGLVALVLRGTGSWPGAAGAAVLYLVFYSGIAFGGFWGIAQAEVLMDPLLVMSLLLLTTRSRSAAGGAWCSFAAGICLAAILGLKYSALPLIALVLPAALARGIEPSTRIRTLAAFGAGVVSPALLGAAYLAATSRLEAFWTATILFNLAHASVSEVARLDQLVPKLLYRHDLLLPVYVFAAPALWTILQNRPDRAGAPAPTNLARWAGFLWLLCLMQVFWQGKFWIYHYHVVLLPLCLMAGVGIAWLWSWLARGRLGLPGAVTVCTALLVLSMVPYVRGVASYERAHHLAAVWRGRIERQSFLATYRWGATDYDALDTLVAAERLKDDTHTDDLVFVWGFEPGIYVYSERKPASRFFYDYPLMPRFADLHDRLLDELMEDLETGRPARVIVVRRDPNDIEPTDSLHQLRALPRLRRFIEANYEPAWTSGDFLALRLRDADAADDLTSPG